MNLARLVKRNLALISQFARDFTLHSEHNNHFRNICRAAIEQHQLLRTSAITAEDYYELALDRTSLPFSDKASFLGSYESTRYYNFFNPIVFDILARDKEIFHLLANGLNIPTPTIHATTGASNAPTLGQHLPSEQDLRIFLAAAHSSHFFFKPSDGHFGEGALSIGERLTGEPHRWEVLPNGTEIDIEDVIAHCSSSSGLRRFLIQERLRPHPILNAIVPDVCPTVRVLTLLDDSPKLLGAALRLGNGKTPTDNLTGGGVAVRIDLERGFLGRVIQIAQGKPKFREDHPLTGRQITGIELPYWKETLELVKESSRKIPYLKVIGWDIGITDKGPLVIEINTHPGLRTIQATTDTGLLGGLLGEKLRPHQGLTKSGLNPPLWR